VELIGFVALNTFNNYVEHLDGTPSDWPLAQRLPAACPPQRPLAAAGADRQLANPHDKGAESIFARGAAPCLRPQWLLCVPASEWPAVRHLFRYRLLCLCPLPTPTTGTTCAPTYFACRAGSGPR
jgi:hypothetical protein